MFETDIKIDAEVFHTRVFIFDKKDMPVSLIIGNELLSKAEMIIRDGEIKVSKQHDNGTKNVGVPETSFKSKLNDLMRAKTEEM